MIAIQRYCRGHQPRFFVMMLDVTSLHLIILFHLLTTANATQSFLLPDYDTTNNNNSNTYSLSEMSASDITAESAEVLSSSLPPAPAPAQQRTTSDDSSSAQSDDDSVQDSSQSNLTTSSLESSDFTSEIPSSSNQQQQQHSSSLKPATIQQFSAASSVINEDAKIKKLNQLQASLSDKECQPKMDVIFVLDTSGSIEQVYAEHIRWTLALVDALPVNRDRVRIAAIQYAGFPLTEFALGTYFSANDIRQHLSQITFQSGVTRTGYALRKADSELFREQRGARANATKIIVLFTDGLSIDDPLKPAHQLRDVKNVKIYVVSVGSDGFEPEMNRIAGDKRNVFGPNDLSRLRDRLLIDAQQAGHCDSIPKQKESSSISRTSLAKSASSSSSSSSVSSASSSSLLSSASSASHTSSSSSSFVESSVSALSSASSSSVSSSSSTSKRLIQSDSKKQQQMGKETITKKSSNLLLSDLTSSDGSKTASASATATAIKTQTRTRSSSRDHSLNAQSKYLTQIKTISRQQQQQQQTAMINNESSAEDGIDSTISTTYRHENLHNQHNTKNADHRNNNNDSSDNYNNNNNNNNDDSNKNSSENEEDKSNEKSDFTTVAAAAVASDEEDEEEAVKETTTIHQSTIPTTNNDSPSSSSQSVDLEADHGSESLSMPTTKAAASTQQLESEPATSTTTLSDESALNNEAAAQSKQQQQHSISDTASIGNSNSNAHPSYSSSNSNVAQKKSSNDAWKELDDESSSTELNGEDVDQQLVKSIKQNDQNHLNTSSNQPTSFVHQAADHLQSELEAADLQQQQNNDHTAAITITPASAAAAASTATTEDDQQGDIDAASESNLSSKISSDNQILISSTGEHRYDEISGEHLPEHEQVNLLASASFKKPPSDVKEEFKRNQLTATQQHNSEENSSVKSTLHNKTKNAVSSKKALKMESSSNANQLNSTVEEMNAFSSFSLASTQQQQKNSKSAAAQRDDESSGGDSKESLKVTSTATPLSSESSEDLPSQDHSKSSDKAIQSASKSKSALSSSQSSSNTRTNSSSSSRESIDSEDEAAEDQLVNANENAEKLLNKTDENELQQQQQQKKSSQRITTNMNTAHRNANDNDDNNGDNDNRQQSSSSTLNNPSSSALASSSSSSTSKSSTSSSKTAAQSAKSHSSSKQQLSLKSKSSSMIKSASAAASKHTNTVTAALNSLKKSNSKSAEASAAAINKQSQLDTQTKLEHLLTSHIDETKNIHKITIPTEKNTQKSSEEDEVEASSTAPFIESAEQTDDESSKINESSIQGSQGASPSQAHSTPHSIAHHHSKQQKQKQSKSSAKSKPQKQANEASNQAVAATIHRASSTPRVPSKETTPSVQARTPPIPRRVTKKHRKANNATNRRNGSANAGVVCPLDFLFIVDSSGSVQSIYYKQKQYLTSILSEIQVGEQRVALLQFAGGSHQKTEWTFDTFHDGEAVMEAFANVRHFTGTTYIGRALEASFDLLQLRRNSVPTIVVLLSDGFSQDDATEPAERIRRLANVDFYTVSISDLSNYAYMVELTDDPEKVFVGGEQSEHLKELLLKKVNCR